MLNSESIVIIRIKEEHLLYSNISGGIIGYGWGNVCYIVNFPSGEYLLYSKVSNIRGKVCYAEGLLCDTGTIIIENENICIKERVFLEMITYSALIPITGHQNVVQFTLRKAWRYLKGIQNCTSKKNRQYNGQKKKDKQWSTRHYAEN